MKKKILISFNALPVPGGAATILEPAGCGSDVADVNDVPVLNQIFVRVKLDEFDERVAKLLALLGKYGVQVDTATYIEYSEEDRQNARLLWMIRDINENVSAGLGYGTKYDMSEACANCGTGARQTSALYINGQRGLALIRKHRAIGTWQDHILVDGGMVKKLNDAKVTGISFGDVRARHESGKWSEVARDQILIEHIMPPMRGEFPAEDDEDLCKVCRRGGRRRFSQTPYRQEDLIGMKDFNLTWEWFGAFWPENKEKQRGAQRPHPRVLVTPKVMNIFREAGVKTFDWWPVAIERLTS